MAQNQKSNVIQSGVFGKLTSGAPRQDYIKDETKVSAFSQFWAVTKGRTFDLVKLNLMTLVFALPAIIWFIVINMFKSAEAMLIPYSANIGIGYPSITDAVARGQYSAFMFENLRWLVMIPLIAIAGLGLSGLFYTLRKMSTEEKVPVFKNFFKGIAASWLTFFLTFFVAAAFLFLMIFLIGSFENLASVPLWSKVTVTVISSLIALFLLLTIIFTTTQHAAYKLKPKHLFKNSVIFGAALLPRTLVILAITALPIVLMAVLPSFLGMIVNVFFLMLGISFLGLIWTQYGKWAYDKYFGEAEIVPGLQDSEYVLTGTAEKPEKEKVKEKKPMQPVKYVNPKKKKK